MTPPPNSAVPCPVDDVTVCIVVSVAGERRPKSGLDSCLVDRQQHANM